jgi:hypothetical protein
MRKDESLEQVKVTVDENINFIKGKEESKVGDSHDNQIDGQTGVEEYSQLAGIPEEET